MSRSLLVAAAAAATFSLVACGGSSSSSSTPTVTPTRTAAVGDCLASDFYGAFVDSAGTAGTVFYEVGVTDVGGRECTIPGPPELHLLDAAGTDLGISVGTGTACSGGGPYNPATCVDGDPIHLLPNDATPAAGAASGQVTVTVAVAADVGTPCHGPGVEVHSIGLRFTGQADDVLIPLPNDITLQPCSAQTSLYGFGPAS